MRENDKTEELLCEVYRNLRMGSENLCTVTSKVKDRFMLKEITGQLKDYANYSEKCAAMMNEMAIAPEEPSGMSKLMAKSGIKMNTLFDGSPEHIADMIVRGTSMGADTLERTMYECRRLGCSEDAVDLCKTVIGAERAAAGRMKDFT
ncbi:MAG: hypothetical protein HFE30_08750 [Clostridiales bacterium]|nr:hypothetical protein [Clostridiales bacterium]